ncbi:uncharacterized protein LOC119514810 [Choloepus didactylus]|uniref:uncharacterized protein LOC119514810 n=1 Tax=Choloepus didactylus TaxID=27675 RepID=UPI00189E91A8|nr:uncharacterized protein LOC119514810 [Choloepus didactylus]
MDSKVSAILYVAAQCALPPECGPVASKEIWAQTDKGEKATDGQQGSARSQEGGTEQMLPCRLQRERGPADPVDFHDHLMAILQGHFLDILGSPSVKFKVRASAIPGIQALRERKRENRKQEELPEDQHLALGQMSQKAEGAQGSEDKTKETEGDQAPEEGPSLSITEPRKDSKGTASPGMNSVPVHLPGILLRCDEVGTWSCSLRGVLATTNSFSPLLLGTDWKLPIPPGPVYPPLVSSSVSTKAGGGSWELSPRVAKSFRIHDVSLSRIPSQGPFRHLTDRMLEQRLAGRKERRSRFGDIDVHKCYQFGRTFSPFQALATMEMRRPMLPRALPMSPQMQRNGASRNPDAILQDLPLTSTELDLGKDDNNHEKEKPVNHIRTPLFPPIVRVTKSNNMK